MKKFTLLVATLAVSTLASAQLTLSGSFGINNESQNSRIINGDGKFDHNYQTRNDFDWNFSPSVGYMFEDYEAGISFNIGNETVTRRNALGNLKDSKTFSFSFGAYGRRYFSLTDKLSLWAELNGEFAIDKATVEGVDNYEKGKSFNMTIVPGLSYDFNEHWAIESYFNFLGLSWGNVWYDYYDKNGKFTDNGDFVSTFGFNVTSYENSALGFLSHISLGISYTF